VGTLARILQYERPQPGLMFIRCIGDERFRIHRSEKQRLGLWVADVELLPDDAPVPVPDDLTFARDALQGLVRNIEHSIERSGEVGAEMPLREPYHWEDCAWLANRWCEMLPLPAEHKQRLLALDSPVLRLELVADALGDMGFRLPG
jgi:Lon protease-like protein